jgi:Family of unknown function (DUF6221)
MTTGARLHDGLPEFLADRYAEAEALVLAVEDNSAPWPGRWKGDGANFALRTYNGWSLARAATVEGGFPPGVLPYIVANDPAHRLADIRLKRAILGEHLKIGGSCRMCIDWPPKPYPCATVRHLGTEFTEHPAYRSEWAA